MLTTSFEEHFEKMSVSERIGSKIEASKYGLEEKIEIKLDAIKAYHMKTIESIDIKISAIASNKYFSSY